MLPPHFLPAYTYTKESLILLHRLSTGLNEEHMPDISARKVLTVIQEVGMSRIINGSCYKPSEEGEASRASCKQDFAWLAKEKKRSNEHSHLGSHPQNDPLSRWTYCGLGQVSLVQCHFENTDYAFLCCPFKTSLPNCQHLLLCSRQVLVLQNEKWNLFWTTPRVPEIAFIQLVSIQLTCENQSVLIPCQRWAMSYDENTEAHFLSGSLVNQFHTLMDINSLSLECVYKIHLSWHSGRMVLEPKYFVQILELPFSRCLSII